MHFTLAAFVSLSIGTLCTAAPVHYRRQGISTGVSATEARPTPASGPFVSGTVISTTSLAATNLAAPSTPLLSTFKNSGAASSPSISFPAALESSSSSTDVSSTVPSVTGSSALAPEPSAAADSSSPSLGANSASPSVLAPPALASGEDAPASMDNGSSIAPAAQSGNGNGKTVIAHVIVGNTYPYQLSNWQADIKLAQSAQIDGFALNMGSDTWGPDRVSDAYNAAKGTNFKMFLSLDMSSLSCKSAADGASLRKLVQQTMASPSQLMHDNKAVVSTFSGESCTFGAGSAADGWTSQFTQHPDLKGKIFFVPSFMISPSTFSQYAGVMDGDFSWNSAWPVDLTNLKRAAPASVNDSSSAAPSTSSSAYSSKIGTFEMDQQHLSGLKAIKNAAYMASVSPWFYTHYASKNWLYLSDDHLYATRWETLVKNRDQVDMVEVISWNDFGESHYIGPIEGAQPNSEAWVSGMPHTAWLTMTSYYAQAYKTGSYPAISKDQIYAWARTHPANDKASDPLGPPKGAELTQDNIWVVVMATSSGTVTLQTSASNSKVFNVEKGVSKLSLPITSGGIMKATLQRGGKTVVTLSPPDFKFNSTSTTYNFNAYAASAST